MAQQTAVDWLEDVYNTQGHILPSQFEQAKQMFEEQIKRAYKDYPQTICINDNGDFKLLSAEQYYNETYNQNK